MPWQITTGAVTSSAVTKATQVEELPALSVTVSVISFSPRLEQSKVSMSIDKEATPQLSALTPQNQPQLW